METLTDLLKKETASLKRQYLEMCIDYATREYNSKMDEYDAIMDIQAAHCADYNSRKYTREELSAKYDEILFDAGYVSRSFQPCRYYRDAYAVFQVKKLKLKKHQVFTVRTLSEYVDKQKKRALNHYNDSILKLALRIEKKELNQDKLELTTSHVDVNISTTITDGDKTVKAWTIIASGPVQRPHYRYLVK